MICSLGKTGLILTAFSILVFSACEENDYPDSVFDPDDDGNPAPVITGVEPSTGKVFAGIDTVWISGENFSATIEDNHVFFDGKTATIYSASKNDLVIKAPPIAGDSLTIKVSVAGAYLFAEYTPYSLFDASVEFHRFDVGERAYAMAMDSDEILYVSLSGKRLVKVTPDSASDYAETSYEKASGMKYGPDGYIYYGNILQFLFRVNPGGGSDAMYVMLSSSAGIFDLDFDEFGNLYTGGSSGLIYVVKPDASFQEAAAHDSISIRALRVFDGYVYVAGTYTGDNPNSVQEGVWKNEILSSDGELGPNIPVFDWQSNLSDTMSITSIAFAADGDMYLGSNKGYAIIIVHQDGSFEPLYPAVLTPPVEAMTWGNEDYLYANHWDSEGTISIVLRIEMRKQGAPYYGRL